MEEKDMSEKDEQDLLPWVNFAYVECQICRARTPAGLPLVHLDGCAAAAQKISPPELKPGTVIVPREVLHLYEFMVAAFSPMTGQQKEIQKSLDLAKEAMKLFKAV